MQSLFRQHNWQPPAFQLRRMQSSIFQVLLIENSELLDYLKLPWYDHSLEKCYINSWDDRYSFSNLITLQRSFPFAAVLPIVILCPAWANGLPSTQQGEDDDVGLDLSENIVRLTIAKETIEAYWSSFFALVPKRGSINCLNLSQVTQQRWSYVFPPGSTAKVNDRRGYHFQNKQVRITHCKIYWGLVL